MPIVEIGSPLHLPRSVLDDYAKYHVSYEAELPALSASDPRLQLSMPCLGRMGRWGNTLLQYSYLRVFARVHRFSVEAPPWLGRVAFALDDPYISRKRDVIIAAFSELYNSRNWPETVLDYFSLHAAHARREGRRAYLLWEPLLDRSGIELPFESAQLHGICLTHTGHLAPHREFIQSLFRPVDEATAALSAPLDRLRGRGSTLIGIHIRRGDFDEAYGLGNFAWIPPIHWYLEWLEQVWSSVPNPVLFLSTDSPAKVAKEFQRYSPVTADDLGAKMPPALNQAAAAFSGSANALEFFPDWYLLQHCHLLAISNSTFSFTAAMLNNTGKSFFRPCPSSGRLVRYEPWASEPYLFLPERPLLAQQLILATRMRARTFGSRTTLSWFIGMYWIIIKARFLNTRALLGAVGVFKKMLTWSFWLAQSVVYGETPKPLPGESGVIVGKPAALQPEACSAATGSVGAAGLGGAGHKEEGAARRNERAG